MLPLLSVECSDAVSVQSATDELPMDSTGDAGADWSGATRVGFVVVDHG